MARARSRKILPSFICRSLAGMPIEVYGDGEQISDMCWVGDVADVLIKAVYHASDGQLHPIAEVGPAQSMTVNTVAQAVATEALTYTGVLVPVRHLPMRDGERSGVTAADVSTLEPYDVRLMPFSTGLAKTVKWYWDTLFAKENVLVPSRMSLTGSDISGHGMSLA